MWQITDDSGGILADATTKKSLVGAVSVIAKALQDGVSIWHMTPLLYGPVEIDGTVYHQYHDKRIQCLDPLCIAVEIAEGREIEISKVEFDTCDGGCDGLDEDWYVEFGECDICQKPVVNFMVDYP